MATKTKWLKIKNGNKQKFGKPILQYMLCSFSLYICAMLYAVEINKWIYNFYYAKQIQLFISYIIRSFMPQTFSDCQMTVVNAILGSFPRCWLLSQSVERNHSHSLKRILMICECQKQQHRIKFVFNAQNIKLTIFLWTKCCHLFRTSKYDKKIQKCIQRH